jgi:hypothetical protein
MPNQQLTTSIITKAALAILDNELDVLGTFYRAIEPEFEKTVNGYEVGSTVDIRRPADFTVRNTIVSSAQDAIEGKVPLTIDQVRGVDFSFTSTELTLNIDELGERVLKPAVINIVNEIARDCMVEAYRGTYNFVGTVGQTVNSFNDFSAAPQRLDENAVPTSMRYAALNPGDYWAMVGSQTALFAPALVGSAWRDGGLGNIGGLETLMTQVMPTHIVGVATGTPLVNGASQNVTYETARNTWSQSLVTDGWTSSTANILRAGDIFTIANCFAVNPKTRAVLPFLQQFVVLADATSGATTGPATLSISPPIISSGPYQTVSAVPADNAAITVVGTGGASIRQNLAYHKNAFALAMVPMVMPPGSVDGARESKNGISIRVIPYYDGVNDRSTYRMDVLYGRRLIDPRLTTRFAGSP